MAECLGRATSSSVPSFDSMNRSPVHVIGLSQLVGVLAKYRWQVLGPVVLFGAASALYAVVRPATWEASQAMVLRNEAAAPQPETVGKFAQPEEMKTVQETLLELARSHSVLAATLSEVGPPPGRQAAEPWPTPQEIADFRDQVKLVPPKGAEFGKSEVFYLKVRDADRNRALALVSTLCRQLDSAWQALRDARARSMIEELEKAVRLASADLDSATQAQAQIETQVGSHLAELRLLHEANAGESALRRTLTEIHSELRQAESARNTQRQLLAALHQARSNPAALLGMPQALLETQPALRRLKEGLVESQLSAAQLQGRMTESHPLVVAARQSQDEIRIRLAEELVAAQSAVESEVAILDGRIEFLRQRLTETTTRLEELARLRAPYANRVAETRKRSELLDRALQRLADARASQAAARAASLLTPLDSPDAGPRPLGPSKPVIVLAGLGGGLVAGLGVLWLIVPWPAPQPARPEDYPLRERSAPTAVPARAAESMIGSYSRPELTTRPLHHALKRINGRANTP